MRRVHNWFAIAPDSPLVLAQRRLVSSAPVGREGPGGEGEGRSQFLCLKGLFTNFEYITFFSCPTERNIFYKRFISIKPLWLEIIEKKGCTKSVRVIYIIYIIVLGRIDFDHPIFSIISSQSRFIEIYLFTKNVSFVGARKKCYIFKTGEQSL